METQSIIQYFENKEINFIEKDKKIWITARAISKGLETDRTTIIRLYNRNKALLEPYSAMVKLTTPQKTQQNTRIFDRTGFIGICMRSNSPRAVPFQQWVLTVIDEITKKGYYIEKDTKNREATLSIMKIELTQKRMINILNHFASFLDNFKKRLETLEKKLPNYMYLSKGERRQKLIVEQLRNRHLTAKQLAKTQNISEKSIYVYLSILQSKGIIKSYKRISSEQVAGRPAKVYKVV